MNHSACVRRVDDSGPHTAPHAAQITQCAVIIFSTNTSRHRHTLEHNGIVLSASRHRDRFSVCVLYGYMPHIVICLSTHNGLWHDGSSYASPMHRVEYYTIYAVAVMVLVCAPTSSSSNILTWLDDVRGLLCARRCVTNREIAPVVCSRVVYTLACACLPEPVLHAFIVCIVVLMIA